MLDLKFDAECGSRVEEIKRIPMIFAGLGEQSTGFDPMWSPGNLLCRNKVGSKGGSDRSGEGSPKKGSTDPKITKYFGPLFD